LKLVIPTLFIVKYHFKSYQSLSLRNISDSPYNLLVFRRWKSIVE